MKPESNAAHSTRSILFVDDDIDDYELFRDAFQKINPDGRVIHQDHCQAALEFLRKGTGPIPDYIFLDINMPIMSGVECLKELKADAQLKGIPVIIYSTAIGPSDKEKYRKLGAANSFAKPPLFTDVVRIIQNLS